MGPEVDNLLKPRHQSATIEFASPNCTHPHLLALTFLHGWDGMRGNVFDTEVYAILIQPVRLILFTCNALPYFLIHVLMVKKSNQRNREYLWSNLWFMNKHPIHDLASTGPITSTSIPSVYSPSCEESSAGLWWQIPVIYPNDFGFIAS